jgi:DNA-binding IscR family transcriptional regulator
MDTMVVGFREIEKFYNFGAYGPKVQVDQTSYSLAHKLW